MSKNVTYSFNKVEFHNFHTHKTSIQHIGISTQNITVPISLHQSNIPSQYSVLNNIAPDFSSTLLNYHLFNNYWLVRPLNLPFNKSNFSKILRFGDVLLQLVDLICIKISQISWYLREYEYNFSSYTPNFDGKGFFSNQTHSTKYRPSHVE